MTFRILRLEKPAHWHSRELSLRTGGIRAPVGRNSDNIDWNEDVDRSVSRKRIPS